MTIAYTTPDELLPVAFEDGLFNWSSGDGLSGSDTLEATGGVSLVPGDGDFGSCLEIVKTASTQRVRCMIPTELVPGRYLRVRVRLKAVSGTMPEARVAGTPVDSAGGAISGLTGIGPSKSLTEYGEIVEISGIIGTGARDGVDMIWGMDAKAGHFGFDLTGGNGGVIRIDDLIIEDATALFLPQIVGAVDVRDFGAIGDGVADDTEAFFAADSAAEGRAVYVSPGTYHLAESVTLENTVRIAGKITMPDEAILILQKDLDLPTYADAFGSEAIGLAKAFQALLNSGSHDTLDLGGRSVQLTEPLDMYAAVPNRDTYATRRVIKNGQIEASNSSDWDDDVLTSVATYDPANAYFLEGVENVANIAVGALVEGVGVGREVYVRAVDVASNTVRLNCPLYDAEGTQNFTFRRFKYLLDFSGFGNLAKFGLSDIEFRCNGRASGLMIPPAGIGLHVRDCVFTRPKNRALTSPGEGCQGMMVDRCQFLSDESPLTVPERISIAMNATGNDVKIRDNRFVHFKHSIVLAGAGNMISGNHWFQGDSASNGIRSAGLILSKTNCKTTITGNYIDNNYILWANEHDQEPEQSDEFSFGGLTINGNIFTVNDVSTAFRFFFVRPHGTGHFLNGLTMGNNVFRALNGNIDRVEEIDTSFAMLELDRSYNVMVQGNVFNAVSAQIRNPLVLKADQNTAAETWTVDCGENLPFKGRARSVESVIAEGPLKTAGGTVTWATPYSETEQGSNGDKVKLIWPTALKGRVTLTTRVDAPL